MKSNAVLAVLLILLIVAIITPLAAQSSQTKLVIDIERTARMGQYGVIHVNDKFTVYNNATDSASSIDFGFLRDYRNNALYVEARDTLGTFLSIDADVNKTSEFFWLRVHFAHELGFNKTYNFTVTSILGRAIRSVATGYEFNFSAAPVLTQDARLANVTVLGVQGTSFKIPENSTYIAGTELGFPALNREFKPWKAYSKETFYAPYQTVNQFLPEFEKVERDIILTKEGTLGVREKYHLYNLGIAITSFSLTLPEGSSNVMAYDLVGAMWATPQNPGAPFQVTIQPRYTLGIRGQENFTFTLTYDLPQSKYLRQMDSWGTYNLTLPLLNNKDDFLFGNATVRIVAPDGAKVTEVKTAAQSPISYPVQTDEDHRTFQLRDVVDLSNMTFGFTLSYLPFWSAFEVLPWILGVELLIAAFGIVFALRRPPELAVPVPVEKLREFVGLYDERLALSRELVVMEEEVGRGSLVKHEFRRRKKLMDLRLDELNKSLMAIKTDLRAISSRYDEMIRRTDRAEAEIEASRASLNQVRGQYRAGKSTRETYETLLRDISKRIDRAEETVETTLITLREEAR